MRRRAKKMRRDLEDAKRLYRDLFDAVLATLHRHDFVHIGAIPNEYDLEVATILPRLRGAGGPDDVRRILHEEFCRWFDPEMAGPEDRYQQAADEVWALWVKWENG